MHRQRGNLLLTLGRIVPAALDSLQVSKQTLLTGLLARVLQCVHLQSLLGLVSDIHLLHHALRVLELCAVPNLVRGREGKLILAQTPIQRVAELLALHLLLGHIVPLGAHLFLVASDFSIAYD